MLELIPHKADGVQPRPPLRLVLHEVFARADAADRVPQLHPLTYTVSSLGVLRCDRVSRAVRVETVSSLMELELILSQRCDDHFTVLVVGIPEAARTRMGVLTQVHTFSRDPLTPPGSPA